MQAKIYHETVGAIMNRFPITPSLLEDDFLFGPDPDSTIPLLFAGLQPLQTITFELAEIIADKPLFGILTGKNTYYTIRYFLESKKACPLVAGGDPIFFKDLKPIEHSHFLDSILTVNMIGRPISAELELFKS